MSTRTVWLVCGALFVVGSALLIATLGRRSTGHPAPSFADQQRWSEAELNDGLALERAGEFDQAIGRFAAASRQEFRPAGERVLARAHLARALARLGRYRDGLEEWTHAFDAWLALDEASRAGSRVSRDTLECLASTARELYADGPFARDMADTLHATGMRLANSPSVEDATLCLDSALHTARSDAPWRDEASTELARLRGQ